MILLLDFVDSPFKTLVRLEAEIVLLRHQLRVLRRRVPSKPRLTRYESSPRLRKLAWPLRPITRWSWMEMPSASAAALISRVMSISSREGLGSPLG